MQIAPPKVVQDTDDLTYLQTAGVIEAHNLNQGILIHI